MRKPIKLAKRIVREKFYQRMRKVIAKKSLLLVGFEVCTKEIVHIYDSKHFVKVLEQENEL